MRTSTLEFKLKPLDDEPSLIVEVNFAGDILSCTGHCPIIDDCVDVTEFVKNDDFWIKKIDEEWSQINWADHDENFECHRDSLSPIKEGLKPA